MSKQTRETTEFERRVFSYLNRLRESGATNMFGAPSYLEEYFEIDFQEASSLTSLWMSNFNKEGNYQQIKQ